MLHEGLYELGLLLVMMAITLLMVTRLAIVPIRIVKAAPTTSPTIAAEMLPKPTLAKTVRTSYMEFIH